MKLKDNIALVTGGSSGIGAEVCLQLAAEGANVGVVASADRAKAQIVVDKISPISNEITKLLNEKGYLDEILKEGGNKAEEIASKKIKKIHDIVGF